MKTKYEKENMIRGFGILGGIIAFVSFLLGLLVEIDFLDASVNILITSTEYLGDQIDTQMGHIIGLIGAGLILISVIKPDDVIPLNWIVLIFLAIWVLVFGSLLGGVLVILAGVVGLVEDLSTK